MTDLLAAARQVRSPTIILPLGKPELLPSLEAGVARVRELAAGRPVEFRPGVVFHPDLDRDVGAHAIRARVVEPGGRGFVVAVLADRWTDEGDVRAGLRVVEAIYAERRAAA